MKKMKPTKKGYGMKKTTTKKYAGGAKMKKTVVMKKGTKKY